MWFLQIVRSFFFTLDSTLFNFIPKVYDLLMTISRTSILTQGQIKQFADRIQIFLGVFMLFRVTFSLITYIIMPDEFSDKGKGFGKLWQNIIISLVLLVLTPYAFNLAYEFQAMVLEDNSLATLVFGDSGDTENYLSTAGEKMAYTIMEPMFSPNTSVGNLYECSSLLDPSSSVRTFNQSCRDELLDSYNSTNDDNKSNITGSFNVYVNNYVAGVENSNLGLFFRLDMAKATVPGSKNNGNETFLIDYNIPVTTVVAVIVLLLLISFSLDIALRSIKLAFLQLISPMPIISYIDPKGKDGMFKKWYQMCFSTYLSLFVRLLALYLGVYIIGKVNSMTDVITGASVTNGFVKIFIIIGVLMFAKQLPKILEGVGIKLDGDGKFQLNPFKKLEDEALGGKQIVGGAKGLAATGLAGASGMASNWINGLQNVREANGFKDKAKAFGKGALSGAAGFASATGKGLAGTLQGKKFNEVYSNSYKSAKDARDRIYDDVGFGETLAAGFQKTIGLRTKGEYKKAAQDGNEKLQNIYKSMMSAAVGNDTIAGSIAGQGSLAGRTFDGLKALSKFEEEVKKTTISRDQYEKGRRGDWAYTNAVKAHQDMLNDIDKMKKDRLDQISTATTTITDAATQSAIQQGYEQMLAIAGRVNSSTRMVDPTITVIPDASGTKASLMNGVSKGVSSQIATNKEASHAEKVDQYSNGVGPIANSNKK